MTEITEATTARITDAGQRARAASKRLALLSRAEKNDALLTLADAVEAATDAIVAANAEDIARGVEQGMGESLQIYCG